MRLDRVKLIAQMAKKGVGAKELSAKSGVSPSTICGVRSGRSCNAKTARALAEALKISLSDLIDEDTQL